MHEPGFPLMVAPQRPDTSRGYAVVGRDLCFVEADTVFTRLHGADALAGRMYAEALPDFAPAIEPLLHHVIASGKSLAEVALQRPDGTSLSLNLHPLQSRSGLVLAVELTVQRIVDQSSNSFHVGAALPSMNSERTRALLNTVVAHAPIGFAFVDTDFRYVYINTMLAKLNGRPVEAHIGRTARELFPHAAETWEPLWRQVLATGNPVLDMEFTGGQAGQLRFWQISYYPVRADDASILGIGVIVQEITERHQAEAERSQLFAREQAARQSAEEARTLLEGLLANAPVGISFFDTALRYTGISANLAAMNGFPREAHLGRTPHEMANYAPPLIGSTMQQVLRTGQPEMIEVSHTTPQQPQQQGHWVVSFYPLLRADGSVIGIGGVRISIGEQKRAEQRQELLAEASRLLASSFDYEQTLDLVGKLIVPELADFCCVDLLTDDGEIKLVAVAHTQLEQIPHIRSLRQRFPITTTMQHGVAAVIRTGASELLTQAELPAPPPEQQDTGEASIGEQLNIHAVLTVPLLTRNQVIG
ncbi:MAG: PAS domain-containing protein, partial [Roseiflexaceae bacterium]|nr:PAS domain-containing protein [Roseiflexaceae bacterium]